MAGDPAPPDAPEDSSENLDNNYNRAKPFIENIVNKGTRNTKVK